MLVLPVALVAADEILLAPLGVGVAADRLVAGDNVVLQRGGVDDRVADIGELVDRSELLVLALAPGGVCRELLLEELAAERLNPRR
jgi:hypothetical protein